MTPDTPASDDRNINLKESNFLAGYIKHLNTLSTGSVLLITIFLEKLFLQPRWKALVGAALVAFLISVISGVSLYSMALENPAGKGPEGRLESFLATTAIILMWVGFLVGVLSLAIFALRNLY